MAYVTIKTVGVSQSQEQVEAEITLEIGTFFLIKDVVKNDFVVNSNANPMVGWTVTEEQFNKLVKILNPKSML